MASEAEIRAMVEAEIVGFIRELAATWPDGRIARDVLNATADDIERGEYYPTIERIRLGDGRE